MKKFLDKKTKFKKMGNGEERVDFLRENGSRIVDFFIKKGFSDPERVNAMYDKMAEESFVKALKKVVKEAKENDEQFEIGFVIVINEFLERRSNNTEQEVVDQYIEILEKILKSRIKEVSKETKLDKNVVKEMLVIIPDKEYVQDKKFVRNYIQKVTRKLYAISKENDIGIDSVKGIKKLIKTLFNENLAPSIAVNILLEKREVIKNFNEKQVNVWNLLTEYALGVLNKLDKDKLKENLEFYASRRARDAEKGRDYARRVQLSQIAEDTYPRLYKVVSKLAEKEKFEKYL